MIQNASIADVSDFLTTADVPHTVYDGACGTPDTIEFRPKGADWDYLLEWNADHSWTLTGQEEPSPPVTVALAVNYPGDAFRVASAVIAVYTGAVDEFRTISYGDIRYV